MFYFFKGPLTGNTERGKSVNNKRKFSNLIPYLL